MNKKYILAILFSLSVFSAGELLGQQNISSTVEVKREWEGALLNVSKTPFETRYSDTLLKLDLDFDYSVFEYPYKDLYDFTPMAAVDMFESVKADYPVFFMKAAIGYPWMPEADLYWQPDLGSRSNMLLYGNHDSFWGNKGLDTPVNRSDSKAGISYRYNMRRGVVNAGGFYRNFTGDFLHSDWNGRQVLNQMGANLEIASKQPSSARFHYDFDFAYKYTSFKESVSENLMNTSFKAQYELSDKHAVGGEVSYDYVPKRGLLEALPYYRFSTEKIDLKAGVGVAFGNVQNKVKVYPHISFDFEAISDRMWLYANVGGGNKFNSIAEYFEENHWLYAGAYSGANLTSSYVDCKLGVKGNLFDSFGYMLEGSYASHKAMNHYGDFLYQGLQFLEIVNDVNHFGAKGVISYDSPSFVVKYSVDYNHYSKVVYMTPKLSMDLYAQYNIRKRIFFDLSLGYCSQMAAFGNEVIDGFADLDLSVSYSVNKMFTVFAKGGNLFNREIFYVQNYLEPGANFALGMYLKL